MAANIKDNEVQKVLVLPRDIVETFNKHCPSHGSFTWFVRATLEKFNELNKDVPTPDEVLDHAIAEAMIQKEEEGR